MVEQKAKATKETKEQRFMRLSNARYRKVSKAMANLFRLTNRSTYTFTEAQGRKLAEMVRADANAVIEGFARPQAAGRKVVEVKSIWE